MASMALSASARAHRGRHPGVVRVEAGQGSVEPHQPFKEASPRFPQRLQ